MNGFFQMCFTATLYEKWLILLRNDKVLNWSKFKAFADSKSNLTKKFKLVLGKVVNIVGKGENAGYQHVFKSFSSLGC